MKNFPQLVSFFRVILETTYYFVKRKDLYLRTIYTDWGLIYDI